MVHGENHLNPKSIFVGAHTRLCAIEGMAPTSGATCNAYALLIRLPKILKHGHGIYKNSFGDFRAHFQPTLNMMDGLFYQPI